MIKNPEFWSPDQDPDFNPDFVKSNTSWIYIMHIPIAVKWFLIYIILSKDLFLWGCWRSELAEKFKKLDFSNENLVGHIFREIDSRGWLLV